MTGEKRLMDDKKPQTNPAKHSYTFSPAGNSQESRTGKVPPTPLPADPGKTSEGQSAPGPIPLPAKIGRRAGGKRKEEAELSPEDQLQREERMTCSFPGLLKIIIPEESFVPLSVAVRVSDLSSGGARVEVHDRTKLSDNLLLPNRFFELKVAHAEIPMLRGTVAWADMGKTNPVLGLTCFERSAPVSQFLLRTETESGLQGPPPLPLPSIDYFPDVVNEESVLITGTAQEAMEIIARRDKKIFTGKVSKGGKFEIKLDLEPESENHFIIKSQAGERRSRGVPLKIVCPGTQERFRSYFECDLRNEKDGSQVLKLDFCGSSHQAERVLYRLSQLMVSSDRISIAANLLSLAQFDRRFFEALRGEGEALVSEGGRNEMAVKLLNELL